MGCKIRPRWESWLDVRLLRDDLQTLSPGCDEGEHSNIFPRYNECSRKVKLKESYIGEKDELIALN